MAIEPIDSNEPDEFDDDIWLEQMCDAEEERIFRASEMKLDSQRQQRELAERLETDMFAWEKRTRGASTDK
jgi:hypothetical protein